MIPPHKHQKSSTNKPLLPNQPVAGEKKFQMKVVVMEWNKYNKIKEETLEERIENEYKKSSPYMETTHLNIFQIQLFTLE